MTKEIQEQRYALYEEERKIKIERCISKRQEIIANTKKIKPKEKNKSFKEESEEEDNNYYNNLNYEEYKRRYKIRNTENNYIFRKSHSTKKQKLIPINKVIVTDNSYTINNGKGKTSTITKDDIDKIQCIKDEKDKLKKKISKKDEQLMRYLQVELDRVQKIKKVKEKLNKKDENIKEFIKVKNKTIRQMENDRYQDHQDINERQKIYKKMISNYDQKLYLSKQQQIEKNKAETLDKINTKTSKKMEELSKQIQDYEDKNNKYKQKITELFDLKDKEEMDKKIKERIDKKGKNESPLRQTSTDLIKKKLNNYEEKLEIEKYRRENALMISMSKFQNKISNYLVKSGEKENKIKNTLLEENKRKEDIRMKQTNHFNDVRKNVKKNEELKEEKRQKLIEDIQKKDLKTYAIKEEKKKINEEKMKMNKLSKEERNAMKLKIQEIINNENNYAEGDKNEELIQKLISENNNNS